MAAAEDAKPRVIVRWKKKGHAAHHGGAWKVAYADFVTAMMALFIVLWLLTQADMRLRQQIAQYFRSPGVLSGGSMITSDVNEAKSREPKVVSNDIMAPEAAPEAQTFGAAVRRIRSERGLTQEKLAQASDLTTNYVSDIERGRTMVRFMFAKKDETLS